MSKKHFNSLAAAVRDWRGVCPSVDEADVAQLVAHLAAVCQADNPRFNRGRFFDACGITSRVPTTSAAGARRKERAA